VKHRKIKSLCFHRMNSMKINAICMVDELLRNELNTRLVKKNFADGAIS